MKQHAHPVAVVNSRFAHKQEKVFKFLIERLSFQFQCKIRNITLKNKYYVRKSVNRVNFWIKILANCMLDLLYFRDIECVSQTYRLFVFETQPCYQRPYKNMLLLARTASVRDHTSLLLTAAASGAITGHTLLTCNINFYKARALKSKAQNRTVHSFSVSLSSISCSLTSILVSHVFRANL